jgi:cation diffusion facilitator family transporter
MAAGAGLVGVTLGGRQWAFLDPLAAVVLAVFLLRAALRIIRNGAGELVDRAPDEAALERIERAVRETDGVRSHHAFRARKVGGKIIMDIHVQVDPDLTVRQGHDIAEHVYRRVPDADPSVVEAVVHIEPPDEPAGTLAAVSAPDP